MRQNKNLLDVFCRADLIDDFISKFLFCMIFKLFQRYFILVSIQGVFALMAF
jgi:hypothetical protein